MGRPTGAHVSGPLQPLVGGFLFELMQASVEEFLEKARARESEKEWCSPTSERQLLAYLRKLGLVVEREAPLVADPVDRLVAEFVEYLVRERGLTVGSHSVYE